MGSLLLIGNPTVGVIVLAALVPALYVWGDYVMGLAANLITFGLNIIANSMPWWMGWLAWTLRTMAWLIENTAVLLLGSVVLIVKPVVYGAPLAAALFWAGLWLFVDYLVENTLDHFWLFRDY